MFCNFVMFCVATDGRLPHLLIIISNQPDLICIQGGGWKKEAVFMAKPDIAHRPYMCSLVYSRQRERKDRSVEY